MANESRKATRALLDLVDMGVVSKDNLIRDLLNWMSESDVAEFAERNGYVEEEEEDDAEEEEEDDDGTA